MRGECPQPRGPQAEGRSELPGGQPRTERAKPVGTWDQGLLLLLLLLLQGWGKGWGL